MSAIALKKVMTQIKAGLDASLDCVALVNANNQIVYANVAMKNFLGVPTRELAKQPVFCDIVKLSACDKGCQIKHLIKHGETLRLDETPAARGTEKLRILLKAIPIYDPDDGKGLGPIGAIISLRDTTGEILLQAKYHKVMQLLTDRDAKINDLVERINSLRTALRRARDDATT